MVFSLRKQEKCQGKQDPEPPIISRNTALGFLNQLFNVWERNANFAWTSAIFAGMQYPLLITLFRSFLSDS